MLTLLTKDGSKTGNAILYGGADPEQIMTGQSLARMAEIGYEPRPLFFVETDFGHHMKMTWAEIEERWTVGRYCSHEQWRADRAKLHEREPYVSPFDGDNMSDGIS